jgi:hypothetical protein
MQWGSKFGIPSQCKFQLDHYRKLQAVWMERSSLLSAVGLIQDVRQSINETLVLLVGTSVSPWNTSLSLTYGGLYAPVQCR